MRHTAVGPAGLTVRMRYSNGDQAGEGLKKGIPFGRHAPTYPDAGHSLRAGLATAAAAGGTQERDIIRQTGHRSVQMLRRSIRDGALFRDNAAQTAGS